MGRPCKCCQNVEECTVTRVFNSKAIFEPNNPFFPSGYEDQWDILRGDPFIASSEGILLGNPATQTLFVGYKQSMGDVIALHKTPMSTSREVNILKLNTSSPANFTAIPGSFINLRSRASLNTQKGLRFAKPLPNQIGSERNFGDYLFFAKENSTGDFAEGWAIRVVVKCVKEINVRGLVQDFRLKSTAPEVTKYGYEVDYQLFNTDGRKVANCLVYLPAYYDWSPFHGFNGENSINALAGSTLVGPGGGSTNQADVTGNAGKITITEPTDGFPIFISQTDNSKIFDPDNGQQIQGRANLVGIYADPNDMIGGILNNIYIESRCDSDYVQFWVSQPSNSLVFGLGSNSIVKSESIYPSNLLGIGDTDHGRSQNAFEFLLFDHKIPDFERPGNRWGFRQADGVKYEVVEENPETEQDGNPNIFRKSFANNTHASFNYKNALMTQGYVSGAGSDSILSGDKGFSGPTGQEYNSLCDPCFKSVTYGSNITNLPTPIFKIVIEDFPEESYSNGSANPDIPNANYGDTVGYSYNIRSNLNGTYYVSNPASQGSLGCASKGQPDPASVCGFRNMLLSLNAGSYTIFDSGVERDGEFPDYDYRLVNGGFKFGGEISLDFFTPHIFFSGKEQFIEYRQFYNQGRLTSRPTPTNVLYEYIQSGWYIEMAGLKGSSYSPYHQGAQGVSEPLSPVCRNAAPSENQDIAKLLRQRYGFPIKAMFSNSRTTTNDIGPRFQSLVQLGDYLDFIFDNVDFGDGTFRPALIRRSRVPDSGFYTDPRSYSPIDRATIKIFMVSEEGE
jgi:hypothetical protein